jgi:hypothetical protein
LDQYPNRYSDHRERLLRRYPQQDQSRYRDVYATFEASAEVLANSIDSTDKDALELLDILAMVHSSVLPLQFFEDACQGLKEVLNYYRPNDHSLASLGLLEPWHDTQLPDLLGAPNGVWDDFRLKRAVSQLVSLSLVTRHLTDAFEGISMHPLTHAWAKDRLDKSQLEQAWVTTGCLIAYTAYSGDVWLVNEKDMRPHIQSYLPIQIASVLSYRPKQRILHISTGMRMGVRPHQRRQKT